MSARVASMTSPIVRLVANSSNRQDSNGAMLQKWGGWGVAGEIERSRRGHAPGFAGLSAAGKIFPVGTILSQRLLTPYQCWRLYTTSPDIRFCVDSIVRRVATWDWRVVPTVDPRDKQYETLSKVAADTMAWLAAPNTDGLTWQEVWTAVGTDLMVHDAGVMELVAGKGGMLEEIAPLPGREVYPRVNEYNKTMEYVQDPAGYATVPTGYMGPVDPVGSGVVRFEPDEVLYLRLFVNTTGPLGLPLIESCLNEVMSVILASDQALTMLDANEIPPGLLMLGGIVGEALDIARADIQRMKNREGKIRVIGGEHGAIDAKWVEIKRTILGVEMKTLVDEARRAIWRVFGIMPIEAGVSENTPRAVGEVMADLSRSHLLQPILELIAAKVNARLLPKIVAPRFSRLLRFEFDFDSKLKPEEAAKQRDSRLTAVKAGAMTINEWRSKEGLALYGAEGDIPVVYGTDGKLYRLVDMLTKQPEPVPPPAGSGEAGGGDGGPADDDNEPDGDGSKPKKEKKPKKSKDDGGVEDTDGKTGEDGDDDAPGNKSAAPPAIRHEHGPDCPALVAVRTWPNPENDLPSDWQPDGRFKGHRTIDLVEAARDVAGYRDVVLPSYREAVSAIASAVSREHAPGTEARDDVEGARKSVDQALEKLLSKWSSSTEHYYVDAAKSGRVAAAKWSGSSADVVAGAEAGRAYHAQAMAYLAADGGLISTMRALSEVAIVKLDGPAAVRAKRAAEPGDDEGESTAWFDEIVSTLGASVGAALLAALTQALTGPSKKPTSAAQVLAALGPNSTKAEAEEALSMVLDAQAHRIDNWSGKLLALTTEQAGIQAQGDANRKNIDPNRNPEDVPETWYIENVDAGGAEECQLCVDESRKGWQLLSTVQSWPGERTCEGRCRCVAQWVTGAEITAGKAVLLGANSP